MFYLFYYVFVVVRSLSTFCTFLLWSTFVFLVLY